MKLPITPLLFKSSFYILLKIIISNHKLLIIFNHYSILFILLIKYMIGFSLRECLKPLSAPCDALSQEHGIEVMLNVPVGAEFIAEVFQSTVSSFLRANDK